MKERINGLRFLVTGGAGFIGSHLVDALLGEGHQVAVIDDLSTGRMENIQHVLEHPRFNFARASIKDAIVLDRLASQSDIILHLAAAVGVQLIVENPVHTIENNVMGTEVVFKAAVRYRCRVLVTSTSEVYGKSVEIPFREDSDVVLGPSFKSRWAYACSKMLDEFLGFAYYREFGLQVILTRLFNTVGPRQTGHYGMVIPRLMGQALRGKPLTVYGDGSQRRCFCDVSDVVPALLGLATHQESPGRLFNIGGTDEVSILELAERIRALVPTAGQIEFVPYSKAYAPGFEDMHRRIPDVRRVETLIGWRPKCKLDDILLRVRDEMAREGCLKSPGRSVVDENKD